MEQFEAVLRCDIIDIKKLKLLAFNGKKTAASVLGAHIGGILGCPDENGIRSLTWKVKCYRFKSNHNTFSSMTVDPVELFALGSNEMAIASE